MKVTVQKEKFLQFATVTKCHIPDLTNTYTQSDLQRPTLSFSLGISFPSKIISST